MLSSNSSSCIHNPNYTPFSENDITSFTSKSEDPNFFFGFPNSPHMYLEDYQDVYLHFLDHVPDYFTAADMPAVPDVGNPNNRAAAPSSKKDRHSKINTARGPRDRRMRLSLDIARKFFDLQDLLGYDKASRTVDWLLRNSSSAIRDLKRGRLDHCSLGVSESCTSEDCGEAVSSSDKITAAAACGKINRRGKRGKRGVQQKRATVARESRRKARERARERTSQKRRLMRESVDVPMYDAAVQVDEDLSSRISGATTQGQGVLCPWITNTAFLHQDEQIEEFQFNDKPWEAYNSFNMSG